MKSVCCVPYCTTSNQTAGVSLHAFPSDKMLRKAWIQQIRRDTRKSRNNPHPFTVTKHTRICALHFEKKCIRINSEKCRLQPKAVPTIFQWTRSSQKRRTTNRITANTITNPSGTLLAPGTSPIEIVVNNSQENVRIEEPSFNAITSEPSRNDMSHQVNGEIAPQNALDFEKMYLDLLMDLEHSKKQNIELNNRVKELQDSMDFKKMYFQQLIELDDCKKQNIELNNHVKELQLSMDFRKMYFQQRIELDDCKKQNTEFNNRVKELQHSIEDTLDFKKMYFELLIELDDCKKQNTELKTRVEGLLEIENQHSASFTSHGSGSQDNTVLHETVALKINQFTWHFFQTNPHLVLFYTGFIDFEMLNLVLSTLFDFTNSNIIKMNYSKSGVFAHSKLSKEDQFILVLMRLRQGYCYQHLSTLFNISIGSVANIFISWISFIYIRLGSVDIWPHRNVLLAHALPEVVEKYENVIGFLDATEFMLETPSSLIRQSQTYSQYKSHNTLKGLVVTDTNGAVLFASALFTGSISDNNLLQASGFADVVKNKVEDGSLSSGDIFLADKGFTCINLLGPVNINIPTFRSGNIQFSDQEVEKNQTVAHERIHVERTIRRIKSYKILREQIPISALGTINQIWSVCCLFSNFRNPLRKREADTT